MKIVFKKSILVLISILLLINLSCQKDELNLKGETDYIIFGSEYRFCSDNCSIVYLLRSDGLYKSTEYLKTWKINSFNEKLDDTKFKQVMGLEGKIPLELLNEEEHEKTFGCPDCIDQGGYFLEIARKGSPNKRFRIDTFTNVLPEYVKKIAAEIKASIEIAKK